MHTKSFSVGLLVSGLFLFTQQKINGQAITEYGRQTQGVSKGLPSAKPTPLVPSTGGKGAKPTDVRGQFVDIPATRMPSKLQVKQSGASLYAQQDEHSQIINKLDQGEKLAPVAKALGGGETWYMVRTQKGTLGWVRSSDVAEIGKEIN